MLLPPLPCLWLAGYRTLSPICPPPLPCLRPAGYGTFSPICPPAFLVSVCYGMYIPVINLWAGWAQDAESHLPSLPCLRPAGYRTLCPVCLWAMLSSV